MLRHALTGEQRAIYDEYAHAFQIIHDHLDEALELTGVNGDDGGGDRAARAAALSAFEGAKQLFFNHLLTAMKTPTLIRSVEQDIAEGRAAVIQIVSTGEALMERRIEQIPVSEWDDMSIDMTPREYVLDYLRRAFPLDLYEEYADEEGNIRSRKVLDPDGNPVQSQIAVRMRDELIERLGAMPPVPAALDQLIHYFGAERVAEITGRSRRVVRIADHEGERLAVRTRPDSTNLSEAQEFMAGKKLILVFSGAGGTGRSYHADAGCGNRRRRVHYLLEAGWRADQAIQGLGRSHRTHQVSAPIFRPVTTDVKAERRFIPPSPSGWTRWAQSRAASATRRRPWATTTAPSSTRATTSSPSTRTRRSASSTTTWWGTASTGGPKSASTAPPASRSPPTAARS